MIIMTLSNSGLGESKGSQCKELEDEQKERRKKSKKQNAVKKEKLNHD